MRSPFRQQRIARRVTAPNLPRTRLQRILMNSRPTRLRAELGSPCLRWVTPNRATSAPRRFPLRRSAVSFPSFPLRAVLPFTARQLRRRRRRSAHRARRREAREVLQHQQNLPQEARRDGARGVAANSRGAGRTVQQIQGDREMAIALLDLRRLDEALAQLQGLRGEAHALNLARRGTGCVGDPAVVALLATLHRDLGRAYKERLELKEAKEYYKRASDLEAQARAADASHHARAGGSPAGPADRLPQGGGDGGGIPAGGRHCSVAKGGGTQEHHRSSNGERTHVGHAPAATAAQQVPQRHSNGQRKGEGWRDVPRGVKSAGRSRSELGRVKLEKGRGGGTAGPPRASWDGPAPMKAPFKVGLREWAGGHPPGGWGSGQAGGWGNRVESGEGAGRNTFASPAGQRYGSEFDGRSCDWWGEAANWQADGLPPAVWGEQTWDSGADRGSWPRQQRGEPQPGPGHAAPKVGRVAIPLPRRR